MAVRHLYETAFDSTASPANADEDPAEILETSRRLCSPEPSVSQRPSPASSRSSTDSARRSSPRSPALHLKKLFTPWVCVKGNKNPESPIDVPQPHNNNPTEDKSKTFSPSVEFKKLDVADESKKNLNDRLPDTNTSSSSIDNSFNENNVHTVPYAVPSPSVQDNGYFADVSTSTVIQNYNYDTTNSTYSSQSSKEGWKTVTIDTHSGTNVAYDMKRRENELCNGGETTNSFQTSRTSREDMKRGSFESNSATRGNLWLDFSRAPKRARRHLCLDIKGPEEEDELEPTTYLKKQEWYHGSISRADAENLLRLMKKGSFLVRCSEKLKRQYLLSLKSSRGVMHVKIVQLANGKYVIKQQAQTFDSIPQLIQYFSTHILNIHEMNVYLSHPVVEKLL
ncbi:SH2 domain-containing adapter protein B [Caerostris extrusa]|uniref:SH2 domain-containing adapter protein B n=1 Tax=Caerostris extrusa TaxID=172846 RepID=A0AAV4XJM9_CAEEX|nr:SH2 domain-containing adapter protein B [Caerostris extrusa]